MRFMGFMRDLRIVGFSKELHGIFVRRFPLTPALSRRERENCPQIAGEDERSPWFVGRMQAWKERESFR